jgi:hypothetical protein
MSSRSSWLLASSSFMKLKLAEVVVQPVESLIPRQFVLRDPVAQGSQGGWIQAVEMTASHSPTPDEPHFPQNPQVLGDLRLSHRELVDDRPDRPLSLDQEVEDLAAVQIAYRVEHICSGRRAGHPADILPYRHISTAAARALRLSERSAKPRSIVGRG